MHRGHYVRLGFDGQRYDISYYPGDYYAGDATSPPPRPYKVEVKWDQRAGQTGRCYFETRNTRQNKESGLTSTTADLWCHVLGEQGRKALIVPVQWLRQWIAAGQQSGQLKTVRTGGADSNSEGVLVPLRLLLAENVPTKVVLPTPAEFFGKLGLKPDRLLDARPL